MPKISFHHLASRELNDAAQYYELESSGLGDRFLTAVEACLSSIAEYPQAGTHLASGIQRRLVTGFPYGLIYSTRPGAVRILAVMNLRRRPMYWVGRN